MSETLEQQHLRVRQSQSLCRDVNERIRELQTSWMPLSEIDFVCECVDESCSLPITASREEYEAVRTSPERFLVLPEPRLARERGRGRAHRALLGRREDSSG